MLKKISLIIFTASITIVIFNSCEKGTEPERSKIKPGRRDYIWTEDTLNLNYHFAMTFQDIMGNSPNDIWLGSVNASYGEGLWHYDGVEWKSIFFPGYAASALWVFEDNTLWIGTEDNILWKRENGAWVDSVKIELEGYDMILIYELYGKAKDDIYAVGWAVKTIVVSYEYENKGIILHYDGVKWKFVNIPDLEDGFHSILYDEKNNMFFIYGSKDLLDILYVFDGKKIRAIMSTYAGFGLSKINGRVYINSNKKVFIYSNNSLVLWKDFTGTDFWSNFVGRSETDFFNTSAKGVGHYNGIDYITIYETDMELYNKVIFDKDIFIVAENQNHVYKIIHGRLKD